MLCSFQYAQIALSIPISSSDEFFIKTTFYPLLMLQGIRLCSDLKAALSLECTQEIVQLRPNAEGIHKDVIHEFVFSDCRNLTTLTLRDLH